MGKLPHGINGPIEGRVGTVIGSSRNGIPYLKGPHKKRTKKISVKEKVNRSKFKMAQEWLSPILPFVREGFKDFSQKAPGFRGAISHLLMNGFDGVPPNRVIQPELVKVSFGDLVLPEDITVDTSSSKVLKFSWNPKPVDGGFSNDQVMLLAYDIKNGKMHYTITGQFRKAGSDELNIASMYDGNYYIYLAFVSADRSRRSNSIYLGESKTS